MSIMRKYWETKNILTLTWYEIIYKRECTTPCEPCAVWWVINHQYPLANHMVKQVGIVLDNKY